MTSDEFRAEAVETIRKIVTARRYCSKHQIGRNVSSALIAKLDENYNWYHKKWTATGVARFIVKHHNELIELTTAQSQMLALNSLANEAKKYQ